MNNKLRAAIFEFLGKREGSSLLSCQKVLPKDFQPTSCSVYRHTASNLKRFTKTLLSILLISNAYADSTLEKVSSVYRLKGPVAAPDSLRSESSAKGPVGCGGKSVVELVLGFSSAERAEPWINLEKFSAQGPCDVAAYPTTNGFELRLSYAAAPGTEFQTLSYETQSNWIVDHWIVKGKNSTAKNTKTISRSKQNPDSERNNGLSPLVDFNNKVLDLYQDQEAWNKILGQAGQAFSFESPELDRFRVAIGNRDPQLAKKTRMQRPLVMPLLSLPMLDAELSFAEGTFSISRFEKGDLDKKIAADKVAPALEGLNYLRKLYEDKEWLKAREAFAVLEKGNIRNSMPLNSAKWWAMKGLVYRRLGEELKNNDLILEGLDIWREGLRRVAGRGASDQAGADFMVLESLRVLFEEHHYYAGAAMLVWAQKYRWSTSTEERLSYLRAEAHYRLGMMEEAHELFSEYVKARKDVPLSTASDRRLLPLAAFRIGDSKLRLNRYQEAVDEYTKAFSTIPTQQKLSFEGNWFPLEINRYPQVFFHRAEAQLRLGNISAALMDLRAFVNFASDHPNLGFVLYRIGDLMEAVGGPDAKVKGAWRECVFRTGENIGGRLCKARQTRMAFTKNNRAEWPRFVADIEDVLLSEHISHFEASFGNDLKLYVRVMLADAFLKSGDPFQSYQQFERVRGIEGSEDLLAWLQQYRLSALSGYLESKVDSGKSSEVMGLLAKAKVVPGLDENRPELIWPLAKSYTDLGLWKQAHEYSERGLDADKNNRPSSDRPYLPTLQDWQKLRAQIELKLLLAGDIGASKVEKHLKEIKYDPKDPAALRMWRDYYRLVGQAKKEVEIFASLKKVSALSRDEWKRYFEVLEETKSEAQLRNELEAYVGPWLGSSPTKLAVDAPSPETFFMLFESRERHSDFAGASTILSYLLSRTEPFKILTKEQILFRQGQLRRKEGKLQEARQSFEAAKALAGDSMWGRLSVSELQSL